MGLNLDVTAVTPVLKQRYTKKKIETLAFQSPAVGRFPKDGNYGGALYVGAIRIATTSAVSASDATAFTTGGPSQYKQWQCSWFNSYGSANITGAAIDQAKGDANALVDAMTGEVDGLWISMGINLGYCLWGNGGGALGQLNGGAVSGLTVTLLNINDVVKFYVGQILQASVDDGTGGGGTRSAGATQTLTGVNVNTGVLTAGTNWNTAIAAIGVSDFLFNQGNYAGVFPGIPAWIPNPTVALGSTLYTAFNNVNRTADPTRLAGINYQGGGAPKSESLIQLLALINRLGGRPTDFYANPVDFADLQKEMMSKASIVTVEAYKSPQIGFSAMRVVTPYGQLDIMNDPFVPQGFGWAINPAEWLLPSMGDVPKVLGEGVDGMEWLRVAGADAYQLRGGYRATTYCAAPGHQGCVQW